MNGYVIEIRHGDDCQYFAGFRTEQQRQVPKLIDYMSHARKWKMPINAEIVRNCLMTHYRDWISPDYDPATVRVIPIQSAKGFRW